MIRILDLPPAGCRSSPDYPAAHSMDSAWFAVDAAGHVGVFTTGEGGHAPPHADQEMYLEELYLQRHRGVDPDQYLPDDEMARDLGIFHYWYRNDSELIEPYERSAVPNQPTHVDQLPPHIRALAKKAPLPILFPAVERIQPLEYMDCIFWGDGGPAYVTSDGVTVRPRPGREAEYPDFVRRFREWHPDARFHFEGLDDAR